MTGNETASRTTSETGTSGAMRRELPDLNGSNGHMLEMLVATSRRFTCDVEVVGNGKRANAKSLFSVAALRHTPGTPAYVEANGDDSEQAIDAINESLAASVYLPKR